MSRASFLLILFFSLDLASMESPCNGFFSSQALSLLEAITLGNFMVQEDAVVFLDSKKEAKHLPLRTMKHVVQMALTCSELVKQQETGVQKFAYFFSCSDLAHLDKKDQKTTDGCQEIILNRKLLEIALKNNDAQKINCCRLNRLRL